MLLFDKFIPYYNRGGVNRLAHFKNINDTYGHAAGDKVLKEMAQNINKLIKKEDTFARLSGDEFSLIIESSSEEYYISHLIQQINDVFSNSILFRNQTIDISCSIGIGGFPHDSNEREELLHLADVSMYEAKELNNLEKNYPPI